MLNTSRTRVFDSRQSSTYLEDRWWNGAVIYTNTKVAPDVGALHTCLDNNHGKFIPGRIVFGDCSIVKNSRVVSPGSVKNKDWGYRGDLSGMLFTFGGPIITQSGRLESAAYLLTKAYAKMNDSNMLIGEMAADLSQTLGMLRRPFEGATQLLSKMIMSKKRRLRNPAVGGTRATANSWLEYRYGWTPLILDGISVIDAFQRKLGRSTRRLVSRAHSGISYSEITAGTQIDSGDQTRTVQYSRSLTRTTKRDAGVLYEINISSAADDLMRVTGSRCSDLPATVWEVIPYSFVVDWFVNVGDWLRAITPVPGITPLGNWVTDVNNTDVVHSCSAFKTPSSPVLSTLAQVGNYGTLTTNQFSYTRDTDVDLTSTPALRVNGLSLLHQIDALSVACLSLVKEIRVWRH